MTSIHLSRTVEIPDPLKVSRYHKVPELGPKVLFFSGGSALNRLSRVLKGYTHNSIHLVTPYDSGGSSAKLRKAFNMPAIGDLRSRLIALADESITGHPEAYRLFTYRFSQQAGNETLRERLSNMVSGEDPLVADITHPMRQLITLQLSVFQKRMPENFDLRGASIGNLILAGGYLNNQAHLDPIIFLFSQLVNVLGTVRAVVNDKLHLGAQLENGDCILGQHLLTGKETDPITSPIEQLFLSKSLEQHQSANSVLRKKNQDLIQSAELICYPPGSFYTSLMANLLPKGVGSAIADNDCPKVYIPNLGRDPEQLGLSLSDQIARLINQLQQDAPGTRSDQLLNIILLDRERGEYNGKLDRTTLKRKGIQIIDTPLISEKSAPYYDNQRLVPALLSLT